MRMRNCYSYWMTKIDLIYLNVLLFILLRLVMGFHIYCTGSNKIVSLGKKLVHSLTIMHHCLFHFFPTHNFTRLYILICIRQRVYIPSHLYIFIFSHLRIFTSSHLHIFTSSHLHIFTHPPII